MRATAPGEAAHRAPLPPPAPDRESGKSRQIEITGCRLAQRRAYTARPSCARWSAPSGVWGARSRYARRSCRQGSRDSDDLSRSWRAAFTLMCAQGDSAGVATVMAWTERADRSFIESTLRRRQGLTLTATRRGQRRRRAARSFLCRTPPIRHRPAMFKLRLAHHVPAGRFRRLPSAGARITSALGSLMTGRRVLSAGDDGEVTLRSVLPRRLRQG